MSPDEHASELPFFLCPVAKYRSLNHSRIAALREARDYEALELHVMRHLPGTVFQTVRLGRADRGFVRPNTPATGWNGA